jgi:tRNA 2-thiouridine synthesizing protein A
MTPPEPHTLIDERGSRCPLPIIALSKALGGLPPASIVEIIADDPAADVDIPAWCRLKGAQLMDSFAASDGHGGVHYVVQLPG